MITILLGSSAWDSRAAAQVFGPPAALNTNAATDSGEDRDRSVTTDGAGNWVAVWGSDEALGGIGTDNDILVSRSSDAGANWTAPAALNTNAATDSGDDTIPQVTTDGVGNWVVVWRSNDSLGATIGTDYDILVSRSSDSGANWSAPAALNTNAATDSENDNFPQVTTDGAGNWVAVWHSNEPLGGIGADYDILVSRSSDAGGSWSAPAALNTNAATDAGDDFQPQLTTDGVGNWVAVWQSQDSLGGTIGTDRDSLVSRSIDSGASWTAPAALNTNAATDSGEDQYHEIATDGAGNWVAVWRSTDSLGATIGTDNDILVTRSSDAGASWSAPAALNTNAATDSGNDNYPQVTTDGAGDWVAVWHSDEPLGGIGSDYDILVSRSSDAGASWSALAALNTNAATDAGDDFQPQLTTDGVGNWVANWQSQDSLDGTIDTDRDILYATGSGPDTDGDGLSDGAEVNVHGTDPNDADSDDDDASDSNEVLLGTDPNDAESIRVVSALNTNAASDSGSDEYPRVTTDGTGNWVAVWASDDTLGSTIGTDEDLLVSRSSDEGANWTAPAALGSNAATDSGDDGYPSVTTDGGGNWVAVWQSDDTLGATIGSDLDLLVSRSSDAGQSWSAPVELNTNASTDSGDDLRPQVASDGAGKWVAIWYSNDTLGAVVGSDYDILVSRSIDAGATWTAPEALGTNAGTDLGNDWDPHLATDAGGNWVAVWHSYDDLSGTIGTDADVLVSRSIDDGATWTAPAALGSNAATDSGADSGQRVMTDGGGNWVAVWQSDDTLGATIGSDYDILVSRSSDAGQSWSAPVELNTNASGDSGDDRRPQVASDGAGNWVAVWDSDDSLGGTIGGDHDILFSRASDVSAIWTVPMALGPNAATDSGSDYAPHLTTDGIGNWVAIWHSRETLGGTIGGDFDILFLVGTGPDLDGDGLVDAAEVNVYGTDPDDEDSDGDGLEDGAEVTLGTDPLDTDTDNDGVCDGGFPALSCSSAGPDNCPFYSSTDLTNSDAHPAGDVCQCGDVTNDDVIDLMDLQAVREEIVGATHAGEFVAGRCSVVGAIDDCDLLDASRLQRYLAGIDDALEMVCDAYFD